jgi:hypothetical protein
VANGKTGGTGWRTAGAAIVLAVAIVAVLAGAAYVMGWRLSRPLVTASCAADGTIDPAVREALDRAALDFVNAVSGTNPIAAYAMLAGDTKGAITPDKFLGALRPSIDAVEPFTGIHVAHAYFVRAPVGGANLRVICGSVDSPDKWVAVTAKPIPEQAHVVVEAAGKQGQWAFVLWLVPEPTWRVAGFNFVATGMAGKTLSDVLAMARDQQAQRHDFNAVMLYGAAARLAARGNSLQLGIEPYLQELIAKLPVPAFLQGKLPLNWKFGDNNYKIDTIGAAGVGDKIYLVVTQELSPWRGDQDAIARNRALVGNFVKAVPEYAATFAGLIVVARDETGAHFYRTVATNQAEVKSDAKPADAKPVEASPTAPAPAPAAK